MNPNQILHATGKNIGKPPRRWVWKPRPKPHMPGWVNSDDAISRIYLSHDQILRDGVVRWAAVVQANNSLYAPGTETSGAQVIYSPSGVAPLDCLLATASRIFALKGTEPEHPEERRLANMITDEYERALDWKVPTTLTDGFDVVTTICMIARPYVPGRMLAQGFFPILANPETMLALLVPCEYWEKSFRDDWAAEADRRAAERQAEYERAEPERLARLKELKEKCRETPPVSLTPRAAAALDDILSAQKLAKSTTWLRVGVQIHSTEQGEYELNFEQDRPSESEFVLFNSRGVNLAVDFDSLPHLQGVTIDWKGEGGQRGFKFLRDDD